MSRQSHFQPSSLVTRLGKAQVLGFQIHSAPHSGHLWREPAHGRRLCLSLFLLTLTNQNQCLKKTKQQQQKNPKKIKMNWLPICFSLLQDNYVFKMMLSLLIHITKF